MRRGNGYDVLGLLNMFKFFTEKHRNVGYILHLHNLALKMELKFRTKTSVQGKYHITVH